MSQKKPESLRRRLVALLFGCVIAFLFLEVALRIYNPIAPRLRGDKIVLQTNLTYRITNPGVPGFDDPIIVTKNSLGFRGSEPPARFEEYTTIVAVGGSTTEGFYVSDGKTWPDRVETLLKKDHPKVWVNNAGLDGHSTFGHTVLVEDYLAKLKPNYVLFLVGANDMALEDANSYDNTAFRKNWSFLRICLNHSETFNLAVYFVRCYNASHSGVGHNFSQKRPKPADLPVEKLSEAKQLHATYLPSFRSRLTNLVQATRNHGIEPILLTQPTKYPRAPTDATLVSLDHISRESLELYNDITRELGKEQKVLTIDLAAEVSGDQDAFYDSYHFTNEGAEKVSRIVAQQLESSIRLGPSR